MSIRNVPAGRLIKAQEMFRRRAYQNSLIIVYVIVCQRCRAIDVESPALPNTLIIVHVGVGQCCRAIDVESPTILPTMNTLSHVTFQLGGSKFKESSKYEHTYASFSNTLVSVSVAVPAMWSPPPSNCQRNREHAYRSSGAEP